MDTIIYMDETETELLKLLNATDRTSSIRGLTFKEIKKLWGRGERQTYRRIEELLADNKIECIKERRINNAGYPCEIPVYRLK